MAGISYSVIESRRFGRSIHRGASDCINLDMIGSYIRRHDPEILIIRFPVSEQVNLHKLNELDRQVIFADTLVCYELLNSDSRVLELVNKDVGFIEASSKDYKLLDELVRTIFHDYSNHYFANPLLDRDKIVEGYSEWATNYISAPQKLSLIVQLEGIPIGFITCSYDATGAEIILNGILPDYRKRGIYGDTVRFVVNRFFGRGIKSIKISTQMQNFKVQNAWIRQGFFVKEAFVTIHLNKTH